ncbi:von Hippel-Lindau disease tumor suppressor [Rhinoderma darwinii]|uniref:von Hippel-Lindau disease tumor suppressor n=1 Tax=Rhinoderma darwinii TaxID=43563 RepID=UPI003F661753
MTCRDVTAGCYGDTLGPSLQFYSLGMELEIPRPDGFPRLQSINSRVLTCVVFCNLSSRDVQPIWVDFQGNPKPFPALSPRTSYRMNTYLGHIWLFREVDTGVALTVNKKEIYVVSLNVNGQPTMIKICLPVFSLKDRCLQVIRSLVKSDDYRKLEIVASLYDDLDNRPNIEKDLRRLSIYYGNQPATENS